jgi:hypothetical protein
MLLCSNGVTVRAEKVWSLPLDEYRLDYRSGSDELTISRSGRRHAQLDVAVQSRWEDILATHLAGVEVRKPDVTWKYKQHLADLFELPRFWAREPGTIPLWEGGRLKLLSLNAVVELPSFWVVYEVTDLPSIMLALKSYGQRHGPKGVNRLNAQALLFEDVGQLCRKHWEMLWAKRGVGAISWLDARTVTVEWRSDIETSVNTGSSWGSELTLLAGVHVAKTPSTDNVGVRIPIGHSHFVVMLNDSHEFTRWFLKVYNSTQGTAHAELARRLAQRVFSACAEPNDEELLALNDFLVQWSKLPDIDDTLACPVDPEFKQDQFLLSYPGTSP